MFGDQMRSIGRVAKICRALNELGQGEFATATELGEVCAISERAIGAYIEHMRDGLLLPVHTTPRGHAFEHPVEFVPLMPIAKTLCYTLMRALKGVRRYCTEQQKAALTTLFKRISGVLHESGDVDIVKMDERISFGGIFKPRFDLGLVDFFHRAAVEHIQVKVLYDTPGKGKKYRTLNPLHVHELDIGWVIFCWDSWTKKVRRFSPARMENIRLTGETFERPKEFKVEKYLDGALDIYTGDEIVEVKIYFTKKIAHLLREFDINTQAGRVEKHGPGCIVRLRVSSFIDVHSFLGRFSGEAIPMEPRELVEQWGATGAKITERAAAVLGGHFRAV